MPDIRQKIITINAQAFFNFCSKRPGEEKERFKLYLENYSLRRYVIKQEDEREDCALFYQFCKEIESVWRDKEKQSFKRTDKILYDKLVIVDFGKIFQPLDKENAGAWKIENQKILLNDSKDLVKNGFDMYFEGFENPVHMVAFDKSGSMSRNSRISFIDEDFYEGLNTRLNLGMDFSKISVIESKYYAYRGLYLSSSKRVKHPKFVINPETIVIIKDVRTKRDNPEMPVTRYNYEKKVPLATTEIKVVKDADFREVLQCNFQKPQIKDFEYVDIPFDGSGFITPEYASYINEALNIKGATSFQIRLPFMKGMLHEVDVHEFLETYNGKKGEQLYEDAFGIKRDLSKAHIFITESMFKGMKWIRQYLDSASDKATNMDPMVFYCDAMKKYDHALYISGTNLPYGNSQYTHLSYQMINTLHFTEGQFKKIVKRHCFFIQNPIEYLKDCEEMTVDDDDNNIQEEDSDTQENDEETIVVRQISNWKRALFKNSALKSDGYIKSQLKNVQKGLLTKLATGKLVVEGQNRYLCRDLLPLLASLLEDENVISKFWPKYRYFRFYLPVGTQSGCWEDLKLNCDSYYAFFRSPHLSRNEQVIMKRFEMTTEDLYADRVNYNSFKGHIELYDKYFKKLTGIVMVPRGSSAPLCLGGADFDGDLVNVVANQDVVEAVASGAYEAGGYRTNRLVPYFKRTLPVIKIPTSKGNPVTIQKHVPFFHIQNTFSNRIGQISDAAIAIGQIEYERNQKLPSKDESGLVFTSDSPTCAKCTILTGLEIDAAKNGLHPDLDIILKAGIDKSAYIIFLRDIEKLRGEEGYNLDNLSMTRKNIVGKRCLCVSAKNCKTQATFEIQEGGTYINELPLYFEEGLKQYKKKKETKRVQFFKYSKKISDTEKENIERFKLRCQGILNSYAFYVNKFLRVLKNEKKDTFYAPENLQTILFEIYDEENVIKIQRTVLPCIQKKIEACLSNDNTIEDMRDRLNQMQWLLQPMQNRGKALEQIIRNGFNAQSLKKEEQEVLFHFEQRGYKTLWNVLTLIEGPKVTLFKTLKERVEKNRTEMQELDKSLEKDLESIVQGFYEKNETDPKNKLYGVCLQKLKQIVTETQELPLELKIATLYEITKKSEDYGRFFWEVFEWKEMEPYIEEAKEDVK